MNNEENLQSSIGTILPKNLTPQEHPLHMLDNQADPETKPKIVLQKSIRTYEGDVADAMSNRKTSVMSMAIAESSRKTGANTITNEEPKNYGRKILVFLFSIILLVAGIGGGYYLYLQSPLAIKDTPAVNNKIPSLLSPTKQKLISIDNTTENQIVQRIHEGYFAEQLNSEDMLELILTKTVASTTKRVTAPTFISKFGFSMPDTFIRSVKDNWMYGVLNSDNTNTAFILLKNDFFQNSYAGMLKWEKDLPDELADILNYKDKAHPQDATSTSSISQFFTIKGGFQDRTIMNRDVREFINDRGQLLVLYSFIDKDTLLITTSETTLKSIIEKIEKQTYIR